MPRTAEPTRSPIYAFEGFRLESGRRLLLDPGGRPVELPTKSYDTLVFFLEHPGQVISRATLLDAVWPQTVVDENNLSQAVAALRRTLGAQSILTVPRQGYQFTLDVRRVAEIRAAQAPSTAIGPVTPTGARIGPVMLKSAASRIWLGIAAAALVVVAVMAFWSGGGAEQAERVEGTERADRALSGGDSPVVAANVEPMQTDSFPAWVRFVEARTASLSDAPGSVALQIEKLTEAIALDPNFALAYAQRASALIASARQRVIEGDYRIDDLVEAAHRDLDRALELKPELCVAHALLGVLNIQAGDDQGRLQLKKGLELCPDNRLVVGLAAVFSVVAGHSDQALELFEQYESQFEPMGFDWYFFLMAGEFEKAAERARAVTSHDPTNSEHRYALGLLLTLLDQPAAAERELRTFEAQAEGQAIQSGMLANLVYAYGRMGLSRDAKRVFDELELAVPDPQALNPAFWVNAYLGLGDLKSALEWAERSAAEPFLLYPGPKLDLVLNVFQDPVLERSEFAELRRRPELIAWNRRPGLLD